MGLFNKFKKKENNDFELMYSKMSAEFVNLYIQEKDNI